MARYRQPSSELKRYCQARRFSDLVVLGGYDYLLDRWADVVAAIEAGYDRTFDEYLNDMDGRWIIDEIASYATDEEWLRVEELLPSLDARFVAVTRLVENYIWGDEVAAERGSRPDRDWWYYRIPTDLSRVGDRERWE